MSTVQVRYIVHDVDSAIAFYTQRLGFREDMHPAPVFAMLSRGDLRLVLSAPSGPNTGGGSALSDGRTPQPGGWNRFAVQVDDITEVSSRATPSRCSVPQRHHRGRRRAPSHHRGSIR